MNGTISGLSEEQQLLQDSARRFIERDYDLAARQALVASEDGFSRDNWKTFADLGWLGIGVPGDYGGLDGGMLDIAVLMDAIGRGLVVEPFLSTAVLGVGLLADVGSEAQKRDWLPAIAAGERLLALAVGEPQARYDLHDVATTAVAADGGFRLSGHKSVVYDAPSADALVVVARTGGDRRDTDGLSAFLVDAEFPGVTLRPYPTIDGHRGAEVLLEDVAVAEHAILGPCDRALPAIRRVVDRACIALAAEAAAIMAVSVETTRDYLATRRQFGTTLDRFQVLRHRLVDMYTAQQMIESLVLRVAAEFDAMDTAERTRAAAAVKAQAGRAGRFVGQQAIQLHGGMGMTEELAIGHYFKRLAIIDSMYGDAAHHLARFGELRTGPGLS